MLRADFVRDYRVYVLLNVLSDSRKINFHIDADVGKNFGTPNS